MENKRDQDRRDVVGIGNAIVDVLTNVDEIFLTEHGITKGAMTLADQDRATNLYSTMLSPEEISGGSVSNTMAGLAALGGTGSYIGKVRDDKLGEVFRHDLEAMGISFDTPAASEGPPTARCLVFITPDGQRSLITYLGASSGLTPENISEEIIHKHSMIYIEGYLWDSPSAVEAVTKASTLAHNAKRKVALNLSDSFCVDRHREPFRKLIDDNQIDILFANETEITSLYQVGDFDEALLQARQDCNQAALTRGEKGSVVFSKDEIYNIPPVPVEQVVDTTGAGDLYASGVLYGLTQGYDIQTSGRIGSISSSEVISHVGARPKANLQELVKNLRPNTC